MSGYYQMSRGWLDHPVFAGEAFSRHAAWAWLIEHAAWKPTRVGVGTKIIPVVRGQLCYSLRYMAKAWRWDEAKVRRFIARLEREKMIVCVADAGQSIVTICNYDEYQADVSVADADTDASMTQERRSGDANKNDLEEFKDSKSSEAIASDVPSDPLKIFFDTGVALLDELNPRITEKQARSLLGKLRQKFPDIADAQDAIDAMADQRPTDPAAWLMACGRHSLPPMRQLEDDELIDPDFYGMAIETGCDPESEWEVFRDHHVARGVGFRSMRAAARTWCKRSVEFRAQRTNLRVVR